MALTTTVSQVCVFLAALCALTLSQGTGGADQSLFNLMSQPTAPANNPMGGISSLLSMGTGGGFAPVGGTNTQPPSPSFPTLGGGGGMPMGASQQAANPFSKLLPLLMFSGLDMSKLFMMMLFGGGMGGMGGGMGGMGMLPLMGLMNNM